MQLDHGVPDKGLPPPPCPADDLLNISMPPPPPDPSARASTGPSTINRDPMRCLFAPRSIVLVGASEVPGTVGNEMMRNIVQGGFTGPLLLVNPKYAGKASSSCTGAYLGAAAELPDGSADLAVVMTPARTVPGILDELGKKGVKAVVLISAGFKETGAAGAKLEADLTDVLNRHGIAMVGPNCLGVFNSDPAVKMNATFVKVSPAEGSGALVSQSGAVGIDVMSRAARVGLGVAEFVSAGNSLQIDACKLMEHWRNDPRVSYVMGYLESVPDPERFRQIASALSREKPILMIKSGRSRDGARAASSHTGSLAGSDSAVAALFHQCGIQRFDSIQDLFAAAQAFEKAKPSQGDRVAILSNAGGYAVMSADRIELGKQGLEIASLTPETEQKLKALLPAAASAHNPVDTTATMPSDNPAAFKEGLLAIASDPNVDSCIVPIVPLMNIDPTGIAAMCSEVQQATGRPVVAMLSSGEEAIADVHRRLAAGNIAPAAIYGSLEDAITGLASLERHRRRGIAPEPQAVKFPDVDTAAVGGILSAARAEGRSLLTTTESLDVLRAYGLKVPEYRLTTDAAGAAKAAAEIGYPVVIKLCSKTISHKTDVGGVILDIRTPEQLDQAYAEMQASLKRHNVAPFSPGEGVMVQSFMPKGREVIIGMNEDPQFGKMLMLGLGGIYVEIFKDVQFRLTPVGRDEAKEMISSLSSSKILTGYRGKPGVDLDSIENALLRLSQLVTDFPEIREMDLNPFMAQPKGADGSPGGMAVDGRFILR